MSEPIQNDEPTGEPGARAADAGEVKDTTTAAAGPADVAGGSEPRATGAAEAATVTGDAGPGGAGAAGDPGTMGAEAASAAATAGAAGAAGAAGTVSAAGVAGTSGAAGAAPAPRVTGGAAAGAAAGAADRPGATDAGAAEAPAIEGYEDAAPGGWDDYPLDELAIRDERRTAEDVVRRIERERFILDPDFQRDFVWSEQKQSRLIESILMRIPLPVFYLAEDAEGRLIVVDGRQRLTTLQRFLTGKLALALPDRAELHGKVFGELEVRLQNRVEDCQLLFYIIDHQVPERARLDIFERVNGGEVLTRQQMRNAIYSGPGTQFLKDEAQAELFQQATGGSLDVKKMQDREFVNRFCAFALLDLASYKGDMDDWLARGLVQLGKLPEAERRGLSDKFRRGLANNLAVFGKHAFRKHRTAEQARSVINASLFDVMMRQLAERDEDAVTVRAEALRQAFYARMEDKRFVQAITYSPNTPKQVRARFDVAAAMFQEVFDAA